MKRLYEITVDGCDDSTFINIELTDKEFDLVKIIAEKITEESEYGCQPVMSIEKVAE